MENPLLRLLGSVSDLGIKSPARLHLIFCCSTTWDSDISTCTFFISLILRTLPASCPVLISSMARVVILALMLMLAVAWVEAKSTTTASPEVKKERRKGVTGIPDAETHTSEEDKRKGGSFSKPHTKRDVSAVIQTPDQNVTVTAGSSGIQMNMTTAISPQQIECFKAIAHFLVNKFNKDMESMKGYLKVEKVSEQFETEILKFVQQDPMAHGILAKVDPKEPKQCLLA